MVSFAQLFGLITDRCNDICQRKNSQFIYNFNILEDFCHPLEQYLHMLGNKSDLAPKVIIFLQNSVQRRTLEL